MKLRESRFEEILGEIPKLKVGIIGDACIDVYWKADMTKSELSSEVPHYPLPVYEEQVYLGGGANVVSNLTALGAGKIRYVSCMGKDWRASLLKEKLADIGVSDELIVSSDRLVTAAYCKPIRCGISNVCYEDPRIDFETRVPVFEEEKTKLRENFLKMAEDSDVILVADQLHNGCVTSEIIEDIASIGKEKVVIVDSRYRIDQYRHAIIKPNELETCNSLCWERERSKNVADMQHAAEQLLKKTESRKVLVTLGDRGVVCCGPDENVHIPAFKVEPPIDFVGAGDAFLAAFSLAYAVTGDGVCAAEFGSLASSVTIKKIGMTGTASQTELWQAYLQHTAVS